MVKISKFFQFSVSAGNALRWYPNGLKWSQNTFLWPVDPLLGHFGRFPPAFWGSRGLLGVQNGPKMGQQGAKKGPKWPKMVKISKIFRFSVSAGNALKWYPNGLKRSQNTFLWPVDPLLAHFGRFPPHFLGSRGHLGPKRGLAPTPLFKKSLAFPGKLAQNRLKYSKTVKNA